MRMDFNTLELLQNQHAGWRLLRADHAPLVVCFLSQAFTGAGDRVVAEADLVDALTSLLHEVQEGLDPPPFPRPPREYLAAWSDDSHGWLRCFYAEGHDEPRYEPTPEAEAAVAWVGGLKRSAFVGTESRLKVLLGLLDQVYEGRQPDAERRLALLVEKRDALNREIEAVERGDLVMLDDAAVRDRFLEVERQARQLLTDFRAVEDNFRRLDREIREKITLWSRGKGELLDEVLGERDAIADSDQGRSFRAFYDFLMDADRRDRLEERLGFVLGLPPVAAMRPDPQLRRVHHAWVRAGAHTQRTVAGLSARLRRFVDDRSWAENRRILELLASVERRAVSVREAPPVGPGFMTIEPTGAGVRLPMERRLHAPLRRERLNSTKPGGADEPEVSLAALGRLSEVDRRRLAEQLERALKEQPSVTLAGLARRFPLRQGLAELIGYLQLAADHPRAQTDESTRDAVAWRGADAVEREALLPRVTFRRGGG